VVAAVRTAAATCRSTNAIASSNSAALHAKQSPPPSGGAANVT
jgi:hypothetical protein